MVLLIRIQWQVCKLYSHYTFCHYLHCQFDTSQISIVNCILKTMSEIQRKSRFCFYVSHKKGNHIQFYHLFNRPLRQTNSVIKSKNLLVHHLKWPHQSFFLRLRLTKLSNNNFLVEVVEQKSLKIISIENVPANSSWTFCSLVFVFVSISGGLGSGRGSRSRSATA